MDIDKKSDHHLHTVFSDGLSQIDEVVITAIGKGFRSITFTDHMPLPFDNRYAMHANDIEQYRRKIRRTQKKFNGQIIIKIGLEFEYLQPFAQWICSIAEMEWDHLLVSVHNLLINDVPYLVNGTEGEFRTLVDCFQQNIETVCRRYYETVQMAAQTGWFDIVGHLDVLKKHNKDGRYFIEAAPWYMSLVTKTLDVIKENGMKLEINMAGFNHPAMEQYPSKWIIHEAIERDIPLVLGSDAHKKEALGQHFYKIDQLVAF